MSSSSSEPRSSVPARTGLLLAAGVFASHLPFLSPGYGTDSDTWKFAAALREMVANGHYYASRLPGYPLMELVSLPFQSFGPLVTNAFSAIAAAACAWLVARLFARHGMRHAWLAGAAFAFIPATFIAGSSSIDYLWALAFALAAWLEASEGRAARAGVWLGLAIGTRLTSVLFGAPIALLLAWASEHGRVRRVVTAGVCAVLVGAAWYAPVWATYGYSMFTFSEISGGQSSVMRLLPGLERHGVEVVPLSLAAGQGTVLLWGLLGCGALGLALLSLARTRADAPRPVTLDRAQRWAAATIIALEVFLYSRLPHDEGYLIPIAPFVLLLLASMITVPRFRAVCATFLLAPFVLGIDVEPPKKGPTPPGTSPLAMRLIVSGQVIVVEPLRGPALRDRAKRIEQERIATSLIAWWPTHPEPFLLVAGNSAPMLYHLFPQAPHRRPFLRSLDARHRAEAVAAGVPIFALPDAMRRMRTEGAAPEGITLLAESGEGR
jgi:hypothetical protein